MLEKLTGEEVSHIVLEVLLAHHIREAERLEKIATTLHTPNRWGDMWPKYLQSAPDEDSALAAYTTFIQAQLDGGDCQLPLL